MSGARVEVAWDAAQDAALRGWWDKGLSCAAIAREMGRSKNSIIGRAHRLKLAGRASPIIRDQPRAPVVKRVGRVATLPVLASVARVLAPVVVPVAPAAKEAGRVEPCCWPIGEPRTAGFRYCDATSLERKPYCAEHHAIAWVQRPERPREEGGYVARGRWGALALTAFKAPEAW